MLLARLVTGRHAYTAAEESPHSASGKTHPGWLGRLLAAISGRKRPA